MKFESDQTKIQACIVLTRFHIHSDRDDACPHNPKSIKVHPLIINNFHVKFESHWAKTIVSMLTTRFNRQSTKVDLDL